MKSADAVNKSGQALGRKGHGTRQRVIEATEALLKESRGIAPPVAAIAREAGISPPTFYLYFTDVGEAIFAAMETLNERFDPVVALLTADWPETERLDHARAYVRAFFAYWRDNATLLRARNRLADEGDDRFVQMRLESAARLAEPFTRKIPDAVVDGKVVAESYDIAAGLMVAMERMATVITLELYPEARTAPEPNINGLAWLLASHLTR
ncbi:TetR/AcrR family transcriptional regulator [Sphingomonas crocodyli]|uniref:TetR/AcrR family transcriptional regulator n=1 Tax=Sphingomonas crocodyli TaxID=1979270 RepID=A0A437LVD0_9SPHN|nr:TetR/AcrR family transcriptional regulator [Sphingomonas crocodyli]RVT89360.1 TetR/AcrR family transcriptional regulator [Sphingomonas crocodyli]